jgi:hypothetical protein
VINRFGGDGIRILTSDSNLIYGNYVGTNAAGDAAAGNLGSGVSLGAGSNLNRIGWTGAGQGNVVSGNNLAGVYVQNTNEASGRNDIRGNLIGVNAAAIGSSDKMPTATAAMATASPVER